ncbi:MAG: PIG-L deacetylase family protein [Thermomicrobiales bacterium]
MVLLNAFRGPVLVIVAHPDDVEAHCAGTVARLIERGTEVSYVLVTSGNRGTADPSVSAEEIAARREAEQLAAARIVGVERVRFLRYDDSDLLFHMPALRQELTAIIREERPRTIITHDPYPGNGSRDSCSIYPDHTTLGLMTFQAAYLCSPGPLFYPEQARAGLAPHRVEMLYLIMSDRPNTFVDVEPVWTRRMEALRQHVSQGRDRPEMEDFFARIAGELGAKGGIRLAEGFRQLAPT